MVSGCVDVSVVTIVYVPLPSVVRGVRSPNVTEAPAIGADAGALRILPVIAQLVGAGGGGGGEGALGADVGDAPPPQAVSVTANTSVPRRMGLC
jgi:hypothetical protein